MLRTYVLRLGELLQCTKIGYGFGCLLERYHTYYLLMRFYFVHKATKKREQENDFSESNIILAPPNKRNQTSKTDLYTQEAITAGHKKWNSIDCSRFPKITQLLKRSKCFIHSSVRFINSLKECKADAQSLPFTVLRAQGKEHRIYVCSRLQSCCLRKLIGQRVLSEVCLSAAARSLSHKLFGFQKMLKVCSLSTE